MDTEIIYLPYPDDAPVFTLKPVLWEALAHRIAATAKELDAAVDEAIADLVEHADVLLSLDGSMYSKNGRFDIVSALEPNIEVLVMNLVDDYGTAQEISRLINSVIRPGTATIILGDTPFHRCWIVPLLLPNGSETVKMVESMAWCCPQPDQPEQASLLNKQRPSLFSQS